MTDTAPRAPRLTGAFDPDPGTQAAIECGCTCPVIDNAHGSGYRGQPGMFVYTEGCPLHSPAALAAIQEE